jgi:hypothetical protein
MDAPELRKAAHYRRVASLVSDEIVAMALLDLAAKYEVLATESLRLPADQGLIQTRRGVSTSPGPPVKRRPWIGAAGARVFAKQPPSCPLRRG